MEYFSGKEWNNEREFGSNDTARFSFRITGLDKSDLEAVREEFGDFIDTARETKNNGGVIVISLPTEIQTHDLIDLLNRLSLREDQYGLWISYITHYDHGGIRIPKEIREFYLQVGGNLDFSTVTILE